MKKLNRLELARELIQLLDTIWPLENRKLYCFHRTNVQYSCPEWYPDWYLDLRYRSSIADLYIQLGRCQSTEDFLKWKADAKTCLQTVEKMIPVACPEKADRLLAVLQDYRDKLLGISSHEEMEALNGSISYDRMRNFDHIVREGFANHMEQLRIRLQVVAGLLWPGKDAAKSIRTFSGSLQDFDFKFVLIIYGQAKLMRGETDEDPPVDQLSESLDDAATASVEGGQPSPRRAGGEPDAPPSSPDGTVTSSQPHDEKNVLARQDNSRSETTGGPPCGQSTAIPPQKPVEKNKEDELPNWHSLDFTKVRWNGEEYQFNSTQARVAELLWPDEGKPLPTLKKETIREQLALEDDNFRLGNCFRGHDAWGKMIIRPKKGIYQLAPPNAPKST